MELKSSQCMFVGYDDRSKGYQCFNPLIKRIIVSKDVVFDEHSIGLSSSPAEKTKEVPIGSTISRAHCILIMVCLPTSIRVCQHRNGRTIRPIA